MESYEVSSFHGQAGMSQNSFVFLILSVRSRAKRMDNGAISPGGAPVPHHPGCVLGDEVASSGHEIQLLEVTGLCRLRVIPSSEAI
jgi:hypothetical protein